MSRDTEDKLQDLATYGVSFSKGGQRIDPRDVYISTEPEQEPVTDKPTEAAMAVMPNGVRVSNVYDAYEEGRKFVMVEQEPVAWMNDSGGCFLSDGNKYSENWTALYTAPPKREPITGIEISNGFKADDEATHPYSYWAGVEFAEKHHGIGEG